MLTAASRLQLEPLSTIELHALLTLAQAGSTAYSLALSIAVDTQDQFRPTVNGVTSTLKRMMARGWVEVRTVGRTRQYHLADRGRQQLSFELDRLSEVVAVGRSRLTPERDIWYSNDMMGL